MVIRVYECKNNQDKMEISPKSRKITTSVVDVLFDTKKKYKIRAGNHKETKIFTGFKMSECANGVENLKHNKKRTKDHKYIG